MAEKKKMSVAEILAAARKQDGGGTADDTAEEPPTESAAPEAAKATPAESTASKPTPAEPKPKPKPGERPSVADMLAMARGETKAEKKPAEQKPPEQKPVAKAATAKPAAKAKPAAAPPAERMDTASILAAARGAGTKRGPVSKAEAPELAKPKSPARAAKAKPPAPVMPDKPAYARPQAKAAAKPDEGRRFVVMGALFGSFFATGMTFMTATLGVWTLATARFMFPNILTEPPSKFSVGPPDNFAPGQVETKYKAQFGIWIVNYNYQGEQSIFALSTVCTHLGCTPNWLEAEQKFKCPCHGSGFYKDGINFEGPAPRPLERYAIRIADDGQVEIDKSRKFQEEIGQWEDPASFVPV